MSSFLALFTGLNPLAIVAATFAMLFVSALLYSRFFFGRAWTRLSGRRPGDLRPAELQTRNVLTLLISLFTATLVNVLANQMDTRNALLTATGLVWLFLMAEQLMGAIWRREPVALFMLQTLRALLCLYAAAAVFIFWR